MTRTSPGGGASPAEAAELLAAQLDDLLDRPGLIGGPDRALVAELTGRLRAPAISGEVPDADDLRRAAALIRAGLRVDLERVASASTVADRGTRSGNGTGRDEHAAAAAPESTITAPRRPPRRRRRAPAPAVEGALASVADERQPALVAAGTGLASLPDLDLDLPAPTGLPVIPASGGPVPALAPPARSFDDGAVVAARPAPGTELKPLPWRMLLRPVFAGLAAVGAVLALFVPYGIFATAFFHSRSQHSLEAQYDALEGTPNSAAQANRPLAELVIPAIGVDQTVAEGVSSPTLTRGPAFVPPSPTSPQPPAIVIGAHRILYGGPFRRLGSLKPGDQITVRTPQGVVATYTVEQKREVSSSGHIVAPDGAQRIYLVTASPAYSATHRLIVIARRTDPGATLVAPEAPPVILPPLSGSGGPGLAIVVVGLLFVVAFLHSLYASVLAVRWRWLLRVAGAAVAVLAWQVLLGGFSRLA